MEALIANVNNVRTNEDNTVIITILNEDNSSTDIVVEEKNIGALVGHPIMLIKSKNDIIALKTTRKNDLKFTRSYKDQKYPDYKYTIEQNHKYLDEDIEYNKKLNNLKTVKLSLFLLPFLLITYIITHFYFNLNASYIYTVLLLTFLVTVILIAIKIYKKLELTSDLKIRYTDFESKIKKSVDEKNSKLF